MLSSGSPKWATLLPDRRWSGHRRLPILPGPNGRGDSQKAQVRQILILDNASWHKAAQLNWHHFEAKYLPAYSPDFNPIERLRLRLKADWFWDFIAQTPKELTDRLCLALKSFLDQPSKTASICSIRK